MMNTVNLQEDYDRLVNLAKNNPAGSTFVVFCLLVGSIISSADTVRRIYNYVSRTFDLETIVWISVVLPLALVAISYFIIVILRRIYEPRPEIINPRENILSDDYSLRWEYKAPPNASPIFVVQTNKEGLQLPEQQMGTRKFFQVRDDGRYEFRVKALLPGGKSVISKKFIIEVYTDSISRIKKTGRIKVGFHVDHSGGAFCFNSLERPSLEGFDVDIAGLIVEGLRTQCDITTLEIDPRPYAWDEILEKTAAGEVDLTIASLSITSARKDAVLFSVPYLSTYLAVVFKSNSQQRLTEKSNLQVSDLKGLRIGVHENTTTETMVEELFPSSAGVTIKRFRDNQLLFGALGEQKEIDVVAYDWHRSLIEVKAHSGWAMKELTSTNSKPLGLQDYGIALPKVNSFLCDKINTIFENQRKRVDEIRVTRLQ